MIKVTLWVLGGIISYLVILWVSFKIKRFIASKKDKYLNATGTGLYNFTGKLGK